MNPEVVKRICVIGAGSSGLAAIKACREEGFDVVCYEKSYEYGGLWHFHPEDTLGQPSVMRSTVINTSKEMSAFSDFPPPSKFANFMHNSALMEYFTMYADKFELLKHIFYQHEVKKVEKAHDYEGTGRWEVTAVNINTNNAVSDTFDGVMVCSGHHIYPLVPKLDGLSDFKGKVLHTHSLKSSTGFDDQNVLVIGIGNSAVDAAVEISKVSKKLYLSSRRGSWIFSRLGPQGLPYDVLLQNRFFNFIREYDFTGVSNAVLKLFLNFKFNHAKYGLRPQHGVLSAHITINDALPNCVLSGTVTVKQMVRKFTAEGVIFEGEDDITKIDTVVLATGYEVKYPFIPESVLRVTENHVNLYKYVFPPHLKHSTLAFMGLCQPQGAMFPIAEAQSRWFAQLMAGSVHLPPRQQMETEIAVRHKGNTQQYVTSLRHTIQVFFISYMDDLCSEFGAKPNLWKMFWTDPKLFFFCAFGPCTPYQYRLQGPHAWNKARSTILSEWNRIDAPLKTWKRQ